MMRMLGELFAEARNKARRALEHRGLFGCPEESEIAKALFKAFVDGKDVTDKYVADVTTYYLRRDKPQT